VRADEVRLKEDKSMISRSRSYVASPRLWGIIPQPRGYRKLLEFQVVFFMLGLVVSVGCQKTPEKAPEEASIVLERYRAPSPKVENGLAYDKATLNIGDFKTVVVPVDAKVEQGQSIGQVEIFMEKSQHFSGHPGTLMSIRETRKQMGCAKKTENGKLVLATYGEWDSQIEGGLSIKKLLIRVPDGVEVEHRGDLSSPIRAKLRPGQPPNRPLIEPGKDGWEALSNEPDPKHTAKSAGKF
jgi:hypothetical protein